MIGKLNKHQIDYVFFHLKHHFNAEDFGEYVSFDEIGGDQGSKIYFPLSDKEFVLSEVLTVENIETLFPLSQENKFFSIINTSIVFHHDILKSAFHLLSGYDEYSLEIYDSQGRFPYTESIQYKLDIIHKPLVNYYFEVVKKAVKTFSDLNNLKFFDRKMFSNFGFMLTHDVDRIKYYRIEKFNALIKTLLGIKKSRLPKRIILGRVTDFLKHFLLRDNDCDPYWNFEFLTDLEKKLHFHSAFYFLHKDINHIDSYYSFNDPDIKSLIKYLMDNDCEIGIHGSTNSALDSDLMKHHKEKLEKVTGRSVLGVRQHRLKYDVKKTISVHQKSGFKYDTTLGYAEHEGFRNSYCLPFRIFDHEQNKMSSVWEYPLALMDSTLFDYRKLDFDQAIAVVKDLLNEVKRFNGFFVMLWHNSYFDEVSHRGITKFYEELLEFIAHLEPENVLGKELMEGKLERE